MHDPDISVVIPTYNRKEYFQNALSSCFYGNDGIDMEVVVVDDGSTDGTRDYLKGLTNDHVRPFFQEHQGGQVARNRGLSEARGENIKFLDDDDWLAEDALEREVGVLRELDADVCSGGCQFVDRDGRALGDPNLATSGALLRNFLENEVGPQPLRHTYRKELIADLRWDVDLPCRQDYAFLMEVALQNPKHISTGKISGYKRQHVGGLSEQEENKRKGAQVHLGILLDAAHRIHESDQFDKATRRSVAQKLWVWARIVAMTDWQKFKSVNARLDQLFPNFEPTRSHALLKIVDAVLGRVWTEKLTHPIRKAMNARA